MGFMELKNGIPISQEFEQLSMTVMNLDGENSLAWGNLEAHEAHRAGILLRGSAWIPLGFSQVFRGSPECFLSTDRTLDPPLRQNS